MTYLVELEGSLTGSKCFSQKEEAKEYCQFVVIGLELMKDDQTNVMIKDLTSAEEIILYKRIPDGHSKRMSWLEMKRFFP